MTHYTPSRALAELQAQHDALRGMMERCEALADELDAGRMGPTQLMREVARLRLAFDAHNAFEEQLLRPVLLAEDAFGATRIEKMVEDHIHEHRTMREKLGRGSPVTSELRDVIAHLRAHLESEERYFLSAKVLRDDVVSVESAG
ncbi:MAG TPA: hemerythrin domain-containing protein [Kofleriaceae bacterium]|nr:hemerythrin domain-containing protein [Kofleriaceae bacterium]